MELFILLLEIGIIIIIFTIGFGLTKWLSDRREHREFELRPPFKKDEEDRSEKKEK